MYFGLELPSRDGYFHRAKTYLLDILPLDIRMCILIIEYGSSFDITWTNLLANKIIVSLTDNLGLPSITNFPRYISEKICIKLTCETDHGHIDLLSNDTWHLRLDACEYIVYGPENSIFRNSLPRDAYVMDVNVIDAWNLGTGEDNFYYSACTMHDEKILRGILKFRDDIF